LRDDEGFLRAWRDCPQRDGHMTDMLWHLMEPRLRGRAGEDVLMQLQSALRRPNVHVDLERLAPHLARAFGREHVHTLLERELDTATTDKERKNIQRLLKKY
jgi:hypothetical protein